MVTQVPVEEAPDSDEPLLQLYEDKLIDTITDFIYEDNHHWFSDVLASQYYEGSIPDDIAPYVSPDFQTDSTTTSKTGSKPTRQEFNDLSDKKQKLISAIEDKWGHGKTAETWTVKDAADAIGEDKTNTARRYVNDFKDNDWVMDTGEKDGSGSKLYKLTWSRHIKGDGGVAWDYRERWDRAIDHLESKNYVKHHENTVREDRWGSGRDWFLWHNVDPVVDIFRHIKKVNEYLWEIHRTRKELHEKWQHLIPYMLKEKMNAIRENLNPLAFEFRKLFGKLKQLVGKAFDSCSKWLEQHDGKSDEVKQWNHPEDKKEKCKLRLDGKQHASVRTHLQRLNDIDPKNHLGDRDSYNDQIYDMEKSFRAFLHWAWEFYEYLTEGTSPPTVDEKQDIEEPEVMKEEEEYTIPRQLEVLETTLEAELENPVTSVPPDHQFSDALSWDGLVEEYSRYIGRHQSDSPSEDSVASRLRNLHDYYWRGEGDHVGIYVWDKHDFDGTKEQELQIKLLVEEDREWAEKRQHQMEWPDNTELQLPPH